MPLFLAGEAGESGKEGMGRREEGLLAVQDRRVVALTVVVQVDLPRGGIFSLTQVARAGWGSVSKSG